MLVISTSEGGGFPDLTATAALGASPEHNAHRVLCVLTRDDVGLLAAYVGIVIDDPAMYNRNLSRVMHNGRKLSLAKAKWFFPDLTEKEYRA